jgi:hypothetical protein
VRRDGGPQIFALHFGHRHTAMRLCRKRKRHTGELVGVGVGVGVDVDVRRLPMPRCCPDAPEEADRRL